MEPVLGEEIRRTLTHLRNRTVRVALRRTAQNDLPLGTAGRRESFVGALQIDDHRSGTAAGAAGSAGSAPGGEKDELVCVQLDVEWVSSSGVRFFLFEVSKTAGDGSTSTTTNTTVTTVTSASTDASTGPTGTDDCRRAARERRGDLLELCRTSQGETGLGMMFKNGLWEVDRFFIQKSLRRSGCGTRALCILGAWTLLTAPRAGRRWRVGAALDTGKPFYAALGFKQHPTKDWYLDVEAPPES